MSDTSIKRADWVTCKADPNARGIVKRINPQSGTADVHWHGWPKAKRMPLASLVPLHTIEIGGGWTVTDETRRREIEP